VEHYALVFKVAIGPNKDNNSLFILWFSSQLSIYGRIICISRM